jgi:hypothetical protein
MSGQYSMGCKLLALLVKKASQFMLDGIYPLRPHFPRNLALFYCQRIR